LRTLEGKAIVVTGAGRGIGRGLALRLASEGARVVVADFGGAMSSATEQSSAPAEAVAAEIRAAGGEAVAVAEDISKMAGAQAAVSAALDSFGRLDAMICNAGLFAHSNIWETSEQEWDDVVASHLRGHFCCTRAAAPHMMQAGAGRFVYFSSAAALVALPDQAAYNVAKAGVLALTRTSAQALGSHGITVNCILPGGATRMTDAIFGRAGLLSDKIDGEASALSPGAKVAAGGAIRSDMAAGTWRDPANVAPFVAYLCSDRAAGINGHAFAAVGYQVTVVEERTYGRTIRNEGPWNPEDLARRVEAELVPGLALKQYAWPPA